MNIIKIKLSGIKEILFENSIKNSLSIEELCEIYMKLLNLKEEFLMETFNSGVIELIDEIRSDLVEQIINVRILIKEKKKLNCTSEINKMKKLFDSYN